MNRKESVPRRIAIAEVKSVLGALRAQRFRLSFIADVPRTVEIVAVSSTDK